MAETTFSVATSFRDGNAQDIRSCRPLRGRVILELEPETPASRILWTPGEQARRVRIHVGRVVSFGAPALRNGVEVPHEFAVGDRVLFVFAVSLEKSRRFADGLIFCAQEEIQAVLEP